MGYFRQLVAALVGLMAATQLAAQPLGVDAGRASTPVSSVVPLEHSRPADFGVQRAYFTAIEASALVPYDTGFTYLRTNSTTGLYCSAPATESRAAAQFTMPHGVDIDFFRIWAVDSSAENLTATLQRLCLPDLDPDEPTLETIGTVATSGASGFFSDSVNIPGTSTVDNESCTYRLIVQFDNSTGSCSEGLTLAFYKARIQWNRQISAAPVTATFTDVPVASQFHAEVEALARSGITLGCTLTEFCPNQTLTRLQMAAFLARALGLQFDDLPDLANP